MLSIGGTSGTLLKLHWREQNITDISLNKRSAEQKVKQLYGHHQIIAPVISMHAVVTSQQHKLDAFLHLDQERQRATNRTGMP